jgi:hypothetical protein
VNITDLETLIADEVVAALTQTDHSMRMSELREAAAVAFSMAYDEAGGEPERYERAEAQFLNTLNSAAAHTFPDDDDLNQPERVTHVFATAAYNAASVAAAPDGSEFEWITMLDDKVRETHRPLHGEVRAAGTPFIVDGHPLEYPGQPVGPPDVWINCRCTLRAAMTAATEPDTLLARTFDTEKRKRMAKGGTAMPDGSFPIANAQDLKNAIQAIGRAKDPAKAKAHIRKRARALGLTDLLPDSWTASAECDEDCELVAAPGTHDGPGWLTNPRDTQRLRDYWEKGAGAAKIGWGSPNDLTRCHQYLSKYVGPYAWGTCQNMHKEVMGIWNPESRGHRRAAAVPDGWNGDSTLEPTPEDDVSPETLAMIDAAFAAANELEDDPVSHTHSLSLDAGAHTHPLTAAAPSVVAPPSEWFEDPGFDSPTPLTITSDGRVLGHLAAWETCHVGISGDCVKPPRSATNYAHFRTGEVTTADGSTVAVGQITMDTGHAGKDDGPQAAVSHYDNTGTGVADVNVGEDDHGIWVAGMMRPGVSDQQTYALKATGALSGDWRRIGGNLELVAALAVNVPGFPVPRVQMAASAGRPTSLVAAAVVGTDPNAAEAERVAIAVIARLDQREVDKERRIRAERLARQVSALRVEALSAAIS